MGSMSIDCRTRMEIEATEEAVRFIKGETLESEVPEIEYESQKINYRKVQSDGEGCSSRRFWLCRESYG